MLDFGTLMLNFLFLLWFYCLYYCQGNPDANKGTLMLKNDHMVFVYINRAQTEQQLNLIHDRGIYFTSFVSSFCIGPN